MNLVNRAWKPDNDTGRTRRTSIVKQDCDSRRSKDLEDIINGQVEEIQAWKKRDRVSQDRIKGLQEDLQASQAAHQASEERCHELDDYSQRLKKYATQLEHNGKATEGENTELERALVQAHVERRDLTALLNRGLVEHKDEMETHPNNVADCTSSSEVLALIKRINTQIFHTTTTISDDFQASYGTQKHRVIVNMAVACLKKLSIVGEELLLILPTSDHRTNPTLVQIALQVALTMLVYNFSSPWFTSFEKQTAFLHSIYAEMCKHKLQSVLGQWQWRTMALTYTCAIIPEKGQSVSVPASMMIDYASNVLLACGIDGSLEQVRNSVRLHHAERLKQLAAQTLDFRCIAGEKIVLGDLQVFAVWPPAPFEPACMEDDWADTADPNSPTGNILATTNLGLIWQECRVKADEDTEDDASGPMWKVMMLKPKVVLHRTLHELLLEAKMVTETDDAVGDSAAVPS